MGKIEVYRSAGGNGVRLDASSGFAGAQITVRPSCCIDDWILTSLAAPLRQFARQGLGQRNDL